MLSVTNIKKSFISGRILDGVSFTAESSALTVIEGQNGAGKSTLFNIIDGLILQDEGDIMLDNVNLGSMPALARSRHIAILKQDPKTSTVASFSLLDNFALALLKDRTATLKTAQSAEVKQLTMAHLNHLGLDYCNELHRPISDFSGGQRQLLAFAMATINQPGLLLLDEPTAALDENSSHLLMQLVKQILPQWQIPAVMISHNHDLNQQYADRILVLQKGKIEARKPGGADK